MGRKAVAVSVAAIMAASPPVDAGRHLALALMVASGFAALG